MPNNIISYNWPIIQFFYSNFPIILPQMSETLTTSQTSQLHLVNIITVAQDKLQTNFSRILSRLNHHQTIIESKNKLIESLQVKIGQISRSLEEKYEIDTRQDQILKAENSQINKLSNKLVDLSQKFEAHEKSLAKLQKAHNNLKLFVDQDCQSRNMIFNGTKQKIRNIEYQISQANNLLAKKQNASQVMRLRNTLAELSQQMAKIDNEQKFVQFKLDKFEIANQKNEKDKMNKEMAMMRQLEQKIRSELSRSQLRSNAIIKKAPLMTNVQNIQPEQQSTKAIINNFNSISDIASVQRSYTVEKIDTKVDYQIPQGGQFTNKMITKINETLNIYERRFENLEKEFKDLAEWSEFNQKQKKISSNELQEKINALRAQFSRIWSKFDAFQDKEAFIERRLDEKAKQIAQILETLKETQSSKFDQKLKMLQAEMFANLKDVRVKLQNKVNVNDYEKFSRAMVEKTQNMSDQIILKCDKLEVKKALLFLQSKIKQIILVISQEEQNQRDALLTKKQIKCISCDKEVEKFLGTTSGMKGNWDGFPYKQHSNDALGKFGMTSFGSLSRKLKRLDSKDIPVFSNKRSKESTHSQSKADYN